MAAIFAIELAKKLMVLGACGLSVIPSFSVKLLIIVRWFLKYFVGVGLSVFSYVG